MEDEKVPKEKMTIENIQKGLRINEQFTLGLYVIRAYHITSTLTQKLQKYKERSYSVCASDG